jgi:curli biogenesis system outer membrane secretion channel CsgG
MKNAARVVLAGVLMAGTLFAQGGKETLAVATVEATAALKDDMTKRGLAAPFGRVLESLDQHLVVSLAQTKKFTVVGRKKVLKDVIAEQDMGNSGLVNAETAPELGQLKGAKFTLTATMDSFVENRETAVFGEGRKLKRRFQISAQAVIVDTTTGEIFDTANVQLEKIDVIDLPQNVNETQATGARTDELMPILGRELAEKVAAITVASVFPVKVIDIEDEKVLTLNRGASFFMEGDLVELYGQSRTITDPDTGEVIKRKGKSVGKARITSVEPAYSQAEVTENNGVKVGCQATKLLMPKD